eukprot:4181303-Pleurochrysis_carterae.AAC.1
MSRRAAAGSSRRAAVAMSRRAAYPLTRSPKPWVMLEKSNRDVEFVRAYDTQPEAQRLRKQDPT